MNIEIDLNDKDAWDDSALIKQWNAGYEEYKVRKMRLICTTTNNIEISQLGRAK